MRELHREPFRPCVSVRHIRARHHGSADAYSQEAPLMLGSRVVKRLDHPLESNPAQNSDTRVARAAAEIPDAFVAKLLEVAQWQLALCRPDLLQADQVRSLLRDP